MTHAAEIARESGRPNRGGTVPVEADLEQLPAYEESESAHGSSQTVVPSMQEAIPQVQRPTPIAPNGTTRPAPPSNAMDEQTSEPAPQTSESLSRPNEAPPSYEEAQARTVADRLESDLRDQ